MHVENKNSLAVGLVMTILFCLAYVGGRPFLIKYRDIILFLCGLLALFFFVDAFVDLRSRNDKD